MLYLVTLAGFILLICIIGFAMTYLAETGKLSGKVYAIAQGFLILMLIFTAFIINKVMLMR